MESENMSDVILPVALIFVSLVVLVTVQSEPPQSAAGDAAATAVRNIEDVPGTPECVRVDADGYAIVNYGC